MRHGFAIAGFATVMAFAVGQWSTAYADPSFKVVTAPGDAKQAATINEGSSLKVVTAPGDAKQAQAKSPVVRHADEPLSAEPTNHELQMNSGVALPIEVGQVVLFSPGTIKEMILDGPFSRIFTSDPKIVDVAAITDHSVVLKAGDKQGRSDVVFFNFRGELAKRLEVIVDDYVYARHLSSEDPDVISYGSIEIHNRALLTSQTNFRCGPDGCHYVGELTAKEPAPLPKGYLNSTNNYPDLQPNTTVPPPPPQ
jgi:Pilus formation protein N terminal region